jgi:asparagine synthase (glutamine-hydrolysing)
MPGIAGIIGKGPRGKHEIDLKMMIDCMVHEPFYKQGFYVNEELGIYAGWTCHPDSYADCMPATNESKDVILIFVGEHFDDRFTSRENKATELTRRYEAEGEVFLKALNGWFSGLLIDLRLSKIILFNDRFAMQRIHYYEANDVFLFGSEAKSLLKIKPSLRELDPRSLGELISCNCVLEDRSLFRNVSLLPGGAAWTWDREGNIEKTLYFHQDEWESLSPLDERTFSAELIGTIKAVIPRYFREKERVGISLTGGLDSRMIMACLNPLPGELPCYTFGGQKDTLDISIAKKIAEVCGQKHTAIRLGPSFFIEFPRLAEKTTYVTDGGLDVSSTHDLFFNRLARAIAPIRVTGKFGSEVIRDHTMFNAAEYRSALFVSDLKKYVNETVDTLKELKKGHPLSVAVFKDFPWREYNKISIEQSQSVFRSPYMDNDIIRLMYRAPAGVRSSNWLQRTIIRECNAELSAITSDRGYGELTNAFVSKMLVLYYYALFKADYVYLYALPHWLTCLDTMWLGMNGGRPLCGGSQKFEYYRLWYRRELSGYVREILLDRRTLRRPYFDRKFLEMMVLAHIKGTRNYMNEITKAMSLELCHRLLIDM